jgi:hypothetical protein
MYQTIASKNMLDQSKEILNESGSQFSSIFVLAHSPQTTILKYEEINSYTFLSDVGGIMAVFLEISIWSLYSIFVAPLTRKIDDLLSD